MSNKRHKFFLVGLFTCLVLLPGRMVFSWGFFAHKRINRMAVFTLPPGMIGFYKKHIDYITEHAVDPDKRRVAVEGEEEKHYIDLDHYGEDPFQIVPSQWKEAVNKFTEDTLRAYGIVPWHIDKMIYRLTEAFKEEDMDKILHVSADLGHYVGDSHVPLHTTENYNGQLTNQKGIHGFWESRIPELKAEDYDYFVGRAKFIEKPIDLAWNAVRGSFSAKDSVLKFEAELNSTFPSDRKYSYESRGQQMLRVYSEEYTNEYNRMLNGMVERRLRSSIIAVGSLWYTAWVNAGQPDLSRLDNREVTQAMREKQAAEEKLWETGKIKSRENQE